MLRENILSVLNDLIKIYSNPYSSRYLSALRHAVKAIESNKPEPKVVEKVKEEPKVVEQFCDEGWEQRRDTGGYAGSANSYYQSRSGR